MYVLTLKVPTRLQQTRFIHIFHCFSEKIRLDVSSESSARQRIHIKNQALFSSKDKSKKSKCRLLQFLFGSFRVKTESTEIISSCPQMFPLIGRGFTCKIKPYFLRKVKVKIKMSSAAIFVWLFKG